MFAAWQLGAFSNDAWNVAQARRPNESEEKGGSGRMCVRQREWDWQLLGGFSTGLFLRVLWSSSWDVRHANAIANYATVKPSNTQTHTAAPQRLAKGNTTDHFCIITISNSCWYIFSHFLIQHHERYSGDTIFCCMVNSGLQCFKLFSLSFLLLVF